MTPYDSVERQQLEARMKSGANWFYWIAALSLVTSVISLAGGTWGFFISLGVTQVIDGFANNIAGETGTAPKVVAFVFDLVAAGLFAFFGYFASKMQPWAFVAGMVIYLLDSVVFVVAGAWLGLAFHAFVLYSVFGGYKACTRLAELERQAVVTAPPPPASSAV